MSFAEEEPRVEPDWSDFEESIMREELDTLIDDHAYDFVNIQDGDGLIEPAEILLGGVLQSETSGKVDIWISILKKDDKATTTIRTALGGYVISDQGVFFVNNQVVPPTREDMKHIRFWVNENVASWDKNHSLEIAEELRRQHKSSGLITKIIDKLLGRDN